MSNISNFEEDVINMLKDKCIHATTLIEFITVGFIAYYTRNVLIKIREGGLDNDKP